MVHRFHAAEERQPRRYGVFQDGMINKTDALTHGGEWRGDLRICTAYEDAAGRRFAHVPRNEAVRRNLRPVYSLHPGWTEDISRIRRFGDLPANARRYVAAMMRSIVDVAYEGGSRPADDRLPNLRYLGVGPEPSQIIKDVPRTAELLRLT